MTWTAKQARYETHTQHVVNTGEGLPRAYVLTMHGAVARTWLPGGMAEVVLWRRHNRHAQYQGAVTHVGDQWVATDPRGREITRKANYIDAEAALLPLRNRRRSIAEHHWPVGMLAALRAPRFEQCDICGWEVRDGECTRTDLHWTPESLAADEARRVARRAERGALTLAG